MPKFLAPLPNFEEFNTAVTQSLKLANQAKELPVAKPVYLLFHKRDWTKVDPHWLLKSWLDKFQKLANSYGNILLLHFWDGISIQNCANQLNMKTRYAANDFKLKAISEFTLFLIESEIQLRKELAEKQLLEIPTASYNKLYGECAHEKKIIKLLLNPNNWEPITLVGIGGIGKTAMARNITESVIKANYFLETYWFTASSNYSSAQEFKNNFLLEFCSKLSKPGQLRSINDRLKFIKSELQQSSYLFIIDNLEFSIAEMTLLGEFIQELATNAKFLITSRAISSHITTLNFINFTVEEMSFESAAKLMKHHTSLNTYAVASQITHNALEDIYDAVGGHPLALKLIASMVSAKYPIEMILNDLKSWNLKETYNLYTNVYKKLWIDFLSYAAKTLLTAMPLITEKGGDFDLLQTYSGLSKADITRAISELIQYSLLDIQSAAGSNIAYIHSLTRSFLLREIIKWPEFRHTLQSSQEQLNFLRTIARAVEFWEEQTFKNEQAFLDYASEIGTIQLATEFAITAPQIHNIAINVIINSFKLIWKNDYFGIWQELITKAIDVCPYPSQSAELLRQRAYFHRIHSDFVFAIRDYKQSLAILSTISNVENRYAHHMGLAIAYQQTGNLFDSEIQFQLAEKHIHSGEFEYSYDYAVYKTYKGSRLIRQRNYILAARHLKYAKNYFRTNSFSDDFIITSTLLGSLYYLSGHTNIAYIYYITAALSHNNSIITISKYAKYHAIYAQASAAFILEDFSTSLMILQNEIRQSPEIENVPEIYDMFINDINVIHHHIRTSKATL